MDCTYFNAPNNHPYESGWLSCNSCNSFSFSDCSYCGDGKKNSVEQCDPSVSNQIQCSNLNSKFASDTSTFAYCNNKCIADTSDCYCTTDGEAYQKYVSNNDKVPCYHKPDDYIIIKEG